MCEVSAVDEHYSFEEKAVGMSDCAGFDGLSTRGKCLEEVMSRMRGVGCNFASTLHHPDVDGVLKR